MSDVLTEHADEKCKAIIGITGLVLKGCKDPASIVMGRSHDGYSYDHNEAPNNSPEN